MTASEKLRALLGPEDNTYPGHRRDVLEEALPLIADVVEATEIIDGQFADGTPTVAQRAAALQRLRVSLTTLREHLEGDPE